MDFPNYEEEPQIIRTQLHEEYDEEDLQQAAAKGKMKIKRIENITNRQVTFCKRRNGLLKKAYELSVLCDAEVALVIFSTRGRLYEYANNSVRSTIERYMKTCADTSNIGSANTQFYQQEASKLRREIKARQQGLHNLSVTELKNLEAKLEKSITKIRTKKTEALFAEIELMQKREIELQHANMYLQAQISINERVQQMSLLPGASVVDHGQYHQALASDSQR